MLSVIDPNQQKIQIAFKTDQPRPIFGETSIAATCTLSNRSETLSVDTVFRRSDLMSFSSAALQLHEDMTPGAIATLWSEQGNFAIKLSLANRGAATLSCILVKSDSLTPAGLFGELQIDQTYLPQVSEQAKSLSENWSLPD